MRDYQNILCQRATSLYTMNYFIYYLYFLLYGSIPNLIIKQYIGTNSITVVGSSVPLEPLARVGEREFSFLIVLCFVAEFRVIG